MPKEKPYTVYLAGAMSSHKHDPNDPYGFERFHDATRHLRGLGIVVLSPAETAGQVKFMPRPWYFRIDFGLISQCDAVVMLPGWTESEGAKAEVVYATEIGLPCFQYHEDHGLGLRFRLNGLELKGMWETHPAEWKDRTHDYTFDETPPKWWAV